MAQLIQESLNAVWRGGLGGSVDNEGKYELSGSHVFTLGGPSQSMHSLLGARTFSLNSFLSMLYLPGFRNSPRTVEQGAHTATLPVATSPAGTEGKGDWSCSGSHSCSPLRTTPEPPRQSPGHQTLTWPGHSRPNSVMLYTQQCIFSTKAYITQSIS